jgi:putative ubiquitin-RnfH superfamily antitoxin RatB of RatAB toxin-antitoxin module
MAPASEAGTISVTVAYSPGAGVVDEVNVRVGAGATLADALRASGVLDRHPQIDLAVQRVGIWGKLKALDAPLRERDRVEIYRPLQVDPKEARRLRYRKHRQKTA